MSRIIVTPAFHAFFFQKINNFKEISFLASLYRVYSAVSNTSESKTISGVTLLF